MDRCQQSLYILVLFLTGGTMMVSNRRPLDVYKLSHQRLRDIQIRMLEFKDEFRRFSNLLVRTEGVIGLHRKIPLGRDPHYHGRIPLSVVDLIQIQGC